MDLLNESQIVTGFISEILKTAYQGIRDKVMLIFAYSSPPLPADTPTFY